MIKQKILQLLLITEDTPNKKNKKGIDPELNKTVSCGRKWKKMFHALHKVEMCLCYAKQKINLACIKFRKSNSSILQSFKINTSILKVCFNYTLELEDKYKSLETLLQVYF